MNSGVQNSKAKKNSYTVIVPLVLVIGVVVGIGIGLWWAQSSHRSPDASGSGLAKDSHQHQGEAGGMKTLYTCGMDPEVIQDTPGNCPKCGMKLTPMDPDRARTILEARGESVPEAGGSTKERKILYWRAPMDPTYIRNEPGKSPMGMDLVPVYEDDVSGGPTIKIDPITEQNMGLRYDVVRTGPLEKRVRTVGTVEYDEQGQGTVTTKIDGWVEKVHIDQTGTQVHKGEPLFELYSPQLTSAQEEFLVALADVESAKNRNAPEALTMARQRLASARERLEYFDISKDQVDALEREKTVRKTLTIQSQITGIVTTKKIVSGDFLKAGMPAYEIADLSSVWVIGKVFESDLPFIHLGQETHMRLDYLPGRVYRGRVTYIYPYLQKGTREIPVRMEFHNPGYDLKPGMYATIDLQSRLADSAVLVPDMAVIQTGERKVAYVMREPGKFEPRRVVTGVRTGNNELEVKSGLAPGETVVVSGQFLLDSESRLREATLKMLQPGLSNTRQILSATEPAMPGMSPGEMSDGTQDTTVDKFVCPMPTHAGILYDESGPCPLCGMALVPVQPWNLSQSKVVYYTCPMPEHYDVHEEKGGKCPLCGMTLIPVTEDEVARFQKVAPQDLPQALYTCPMPIHADVVSDRPGECPKCGMTLIPTSSVPHGKQAEEHWRETHPASEHIHEATEQQAVPMLYTCPMSVHADVVSDRPGKCPKCDMTLVPTSDVEHGAESESIWKKAHPAAALPVMK